MLIPARTLDTILFFSDQGKSIPKKLTSCQMPVEPAPDLIVNILSLNAGERITAAVPVPNFEAAEYHHVDPAWANEAISLSEFALVRPSGLIAISSTIMMNLAGCASPPARMTCCWSLPRDRHWCISEEDICSWSPGRRCYRN